MKKKSFSLMNVFGVPISLDASWFLVFVLITWVLAIKYFPAEFTDWTKLQYWSVAAVTSILFFASVVLHELGHSIFALRYKLTVNSIKLYIFGGVSQIGSEPQNATAEFVIALAGPLITLFLAGSCYMVQIAFSSIDPVYASAKYLAQINLLLAVFNLIPGFPLDGGRIFRAIVWGISGNLQRATDFAVVLGHMIAFLFILIGVWEIIKGNWTSGLWIAFIGWFLEAAVIGQVQQQRTHDLLVGHTVEQVMSRSCVNVLDRITVQELVDSYFIDKGQRCLIVVNSDQPVGLLTLHHIRKTPRDRWATTLARQVMTPLADVKRTTPDAGLAEALEEMGQDGVNQLPVMKDGQIEGMLGREDIIKYLRILQKSAK